MRGGFGSFETDDVSPCDRICPGMFFAMNSIFIGIATMLYVFDITKSKDEHGHEIVPEVDFRGFIRCVPFCSVSEVLTAVFYSSQPSSPVQVRDRAKVGGSSRPDQKDSRGGIRVTVRSYKVHA